MLLRADCHAFHRASALLAPLIPVPWRSVATRAMERPLADVVAEGGTGAVMALSATGAREASLLVIEQMVAIAASAQTDPPLMQASKDDRSIADSTSTMAPPPQMEEESPEARRMKGDAFVASLEVTAVGRQLVPKLPVPPITGGGASIEAGLVLSLGGGQPS